MLLTTIIDNVLELNLLLESNELNKKLIINNYNNFNNIEKSNYLFYNLLNYIENSSNNNINICISKLKREILNCKKNLIKSIDLDNNFNLNFPFIYNINKHYNYIKVDDIKNLDEIVDKIKKINVVINNINDHNTLYYHNNINSINNINYINKPINNILDNNINFIVKKLDILKLNFCLNLKYDIKYLIFSYNDLLNIYNKIHKYKQLNDNINFNIINDYIDIENKLKYLPIYFNKQFFNELQILLKYNNDMITNNLIEYLINIFNNDNYISLFNCNNNEKKILISLLNKVMNILKTNNIKIINNNILYYNKNYKFNNDIFQFINNNIY